MDALREWLALAVAIGALALGAYNWNRARRGGRDKHDFAIEHRGGADFLLRNTGWATATVSLLTFEMDAGVDEGLPELFELQPGAGRQFSLRLQEASQYPSHVSVWFRESKAGMVINAVFPYSKEALEAQSWWPPK